MLQDCVWRVMNLNTRDSIILFMVMFCVIACLPDNYNFTSPIENKSKYHEPIDFANLKYNQGIAELQ
jgi:hypothetical protein